MKNTRRHSGSESFGGCLILLGMAALVLVLLAGVVWAWRLLVWTWNWQG